MSEARCAVVGCSNSLVEDALCDDDIQYHSFPEDPEIRRKWVKFSGKEGEWNPNISHICSIHFKPEDYEEDEVFLEKKVLKNTSVPSLLVETGNIEYTEEESDTFQSHLNDSSVLKVESDYSENESIAMEDDGMMSSNENEGSSKKKVNIDYSENESIAIEDDGMMSFNENEGSSKKKVNIDYSENESIAMEDGVMSFNENEGSSKKKFDDCGDFKVIACELCHREFSRKLALEHHLARIHRLNESRINFYLNRVVHHSAQNYKCDKCKRVFYKEDKLTSHVCEPAVSVMCEICQQTFTSKTGLRRHLLAVHELGSAKVDSIMEELADYTSRFYKKFKIAEDIVICSSDGRVVIKEGGSEFKTVDGSKCTICNKTFLDESALKNHVCDSTIEVFCQVCKYRAPTKYNLKRHFILRHKLSENDIYLAMEEFICYNEKWQLRTHESNIKLAKRKSRSMSAKSGGSSPMILKSSKLFQAIAPKPPIFSSSDEQCSLLSNVKTCEKCYRTFVNLSLFEEHDCDELKGSSKKQIKSNKIKTKVNNVQKLICEICQSQFSLRIALKRHLLRTHNLEADAIDAFLERISNDMGGSDLDREVHAEESDSSVKLISHAIEPISCEVCHQKLNSKKDLKGHLVKCFKMKGSALSSIFDESKDYYAKFYEREKNKYDLVLSSSDGRVICKRKESEFVPVPGPRCKKCNKAFVDEFRIVGHECAPDIKITCKICNKYTAPTKHKVIRHLMNVHKQRKDDIHSMLKEFKSYSEGLNLRVKKSPNDCSVKKATTRSASLHVGVKNRSSGCFEEEKESSFETGMIIKEEKKSSDSDCSNSFQTAADFDIKAEKSDCDSEQEEHQILPKNSLWKSGVGGGDNEEDAETKEIICELCNRQFGRKMSLKKHLGNIHKLKSREVDYYLRRIAYENAANFKCNICKKQFYKKGRLESHDCAPAIVVVCELCQNKLTSKLSLSRHLLYTHNLEESKVDSILEELSGFNSRFYRKLKIEGNKIAISSSDGRIVSKKNDYRLTLYRGPRCNVCYKALSEESDHKCATKIEIGCEICKYKSPSKYNLKRHLMLIHKISNNEAKLAMQEFNRYNEKLELRE